ncbi:hypothetical protein [Streptomyces sp. NPDC091371]|uniref:hypothetical protein n=1 Tax=Streptomyces sp. NPDC091371 TaxID=3155303 RepID=UPI0034306FA1
MAFGKSKPVEEPPVAPVAWERVRDFVVGNTERPVTAKRRTSSFGPLAVRVPRNGKDFRVFAPCAFVISEEEGYALYEDAESQKLLCRIDRAGREADAERHHDVHDGEGQLIGTLSRVPPSSRPFKHTWRIDQPGHPAVVGRNEWASGDGKAFAARVAEKSLYVAFTAVASLGAEGGDQPSRPRTLEWRADDKVVMVSLGSEEVTVKADWLDRRLAFAFALVGDR